MLRRNARGFAMIVAALGVMGISSAAVGSSSPVAIDGWNISWPSGVSLGVSQDPSVSTQVDLQETATFTAPNQGFQVAIEPIPAYTGTSATTFVVSEETIVNDTLDSMDSVSFFLMNTGADATFGRVFHAVSGEGYDFGTALPSDGDTALGYSGIQGAGMTSTWGNGNASPSGDNLEINAVAGSGFVLKDLQTSSVPEPTSLAMLMVGGVGLLNRRGRR